MNDFSKWKQIVEQCATDLSEDKKQRLDHQQVFQLGKLPTEEAKQKASELVSGSTTSDRKKAVLLRNIEQCRNSNDVLRLMTNVMLAGEGLAVADSAYGKRYGVKEDVTDSKLSSEWEEEQRIRDAYKLKRIPGSTVPGDHSDASYEFDTSEKEGVNIAQSATDVEMDDVTREVIEYMDEMGLTSLGGLSRTEILSGMDPEHVEDIYSEYILDMGASDQDEEHSEVEGSKESEDYDWEESFKRVAEAIDGIDELDWEEDTQTEEPEEDAGYRAKVEDDAREVSDKISAHETPEIDWPETGDNEETGVSLDVAEMIAAIEEMQDSGTSATDVRFDIERLYNLPADRIQRIYDKVIGTESVHESEGKEEETEEEDSSVREVLDFNKRLNK